MMTGPLVECVPNFSEGIDARRVMAILAAMRVDGVHLLDVREEWEFRRRRVPGAVSAPLAQLAGRIAELPRDKPIAVICEHGHRSLAGAEYLKNRGFEGVVSVRGGTDAWARSHRLVDGD